MSIKVQKVSKEYGAQKALNNVSFEIETGEVLVFLGPNGAGKSTMMKIITGYIPPSNGTVLVNDIDVMEESMQVRKMIGYLPEHNPLYLDMYVKEYLLHVAQLYKLPNSKTRVDEMVELTGLTSEYKKNIGQLSKGYRQRVGLAQALIHDPEVLILDEPTSGLDPNQIIEIRNLISQVAKDKTIMLSTHIMQEVKAICNRIIIIKDGEIVANDSVENIENTTVENKQVVLVEFNKDPELNDILSIAKVNQAKKVKVNHWVVESNSEEDIRQAIFDFAVKNQISVLAMQKKEKSLEEAFQELTNEK